MVVSQTPPPRLHLIQLAGGLGRRAAGDGDRPPKQFRETDRGPLFMVSLREFLGLAEAKIASVTLVAADGWADRASTALAPLAVPWQLAAAGPTRTASTHSAVQALAAGKGKVPAPESQDLVAVHDAARPFASVDLLARLVRAAAVHGGAVPGVPVADTIVEVKSDQGEVRYLSRPALQAVQTPQVFRWGPFSAAHRWAAEAGTDWTDDGGLLAERGHSPVVVPGEPGNWKITTGDDWRRAATLLRG